MIVLLLKILFMFSNLAESLVHKFLNRVVEGIGLLDDFLFNFVGSFHHGFS